MNRPFEEFKAFHVFKEDVVDAFRDVDLDFFFHFYASLSK